MSKREKIVIWPMAILTVAMTLWLTFNLVRNTFWHNTPTWSTPAKTQAQKKTLAPVAPGSNRVTVVYHAEPVIK